MKGLSMSKPKPTQDAQDWSNQDQGSSDTALLERSPEPTVEPPIKKEVKMIDEPHYGLTEDVSLYPFAELDIGKGFFAPLEPNNDIDKFVVAMNKQARLYSVANSIVERNEEGDEVLENYTVNARLRNTDGSFKLDGEGQPKLSISSGLRPKLIGPRFSVRAIHKNDKLSENEEADTDGVLVIRLD